MNLTTALFLSALAVAAGPGAPNTTRTTSDSILVKYCLVSMRERVRLSANEAGPLMEVNVDQGAIVKADDELGKIDDRDVEIKRRAAEAEWRVAEKQASSDVNVRAGKKMAEVAKADYDQAVEINRKSPKTVSDTEVRRLKLQWERAVLQTEVGELELSVAQLTATAKKTAMEAAENEIRRRKLIAPIDAVVDQVLAKRGEWVQPGQPMMELVRIDKLRMEAFLNASEVSPQEVNGRNVVIEITVKDPNSEKTKVERFESKINFVSSQIVADGAYRIATDFENRQVDGEWVVRPGMIGNMTIKLAGATQPLAKPATKPETKLTPVSNSNK
jgi:macrolide-specific efflux system membrane fusion protein